MTKREYMHILNMQEELEKRDWDKIVVKTYNFFGKDFIIAAAGLHCDDHALVRIDCSLSFIERYGLKHTINLFERISGV